MCNFSKELFVILVTGAKLHLLFWTACNAYTKYVFNRTTKAIKKESKRAYDWLMDEPIEHWARYTCLDNTTNFGMKRLKSLGISPSTLCWRELGESS